MSDPAYPPLSPLKTGVRCRCPRCGVGPLFQGYLTIRKECTNCGLDYGFADPADGPAFFVMIFGCIPSDALAVWLEVAFSASVLTQFLVTGPFMLLTCIPPLRPIKGWLVASQYFYKAEEGKLVRRAPEPS